MSLLENTLFGIRDKVQTAIDRIKSFEPPEGYFVAYSGGKDSDVVMDLVKRSGVKYDAHFSVTSVEAPETIYYIRREHPEVIWEFPKYADGKIKTMWNLIPKKKMPPTRLARYCCAELKECNGIGRVTITGVRWAESVNRKKNRHLVDIGATKAGAIIYNNDNDEAKRMVEHCYRTRKTLVNPIIDWSDDDVWEYIKTRKLKYNPLYDNGVRRVGCIGCPMNTRRAEEMEKYPKIKELYLRAFSKMLQAIGETRTSACLWKDENDVMRWYLTGKNYGDKTQTTLFTEDE